MPIRGPLRAEQEAPIETTFEKTGPQSIMRLADRIEEVRRDIVRLQGQWHSLDPIERRDIAMKINANLEVLYQETLGYAEGRNRTDDYLDDIEATQDDDGESEPLEALRVIVNWLEIFDMYASSERVPPDYGEQLRNMIIRNMAALPDEKQPSSAPPPSKEQAALTEMQAFESEDESEEDEGEDESEEPEESEDDLDG